MAERKRIRLDEEPLVSLPPPPVLSADNTNSDFQVGEEAVNEVFGDKALRNEVLRRVIHPSTSSLASSVRDDPDINYAENNNQDGHTLYHLHGIDNLKLFVDNLEKIKKDIGIYTSSEKKPVLRPFKMTLSSSFFVPENFRLFSNLLKKCGSGLVSLKIVIPKYSTMPFLSLPAFHLPVLERLAIEFVNYSYSEPKDQIDSQIQQNYGVSVFIQHLLSSCSKLQSIEFKTSPDPETIPVLFEVIKLPQTVKTILLNGAFTHWHLDIMFPNSRIPHITNITLHVMVTGTANEATDALNCDAMRKFLLRNSRTLKILKFSVGDHFPPSKPKSETLPFLSCVPAMKNLEEITFSSPNWRVTGDFKMKSSKFPKLTNFKMDGISGDLFEMLTASDMDRRVRINSVKQLQIWLIDQRFGCTLTLNMDKMKRLHQTFCNVTSLDVTICGVDTSGMKYIFGEMGKLESLAIKVRKCNAGGEEMTCDHFDALFIGAPKLVAKGLRDNPEYWKLLNWKTGYAEHPSIMRLKVLSTLILATEGMEVHYLPGGDVRDGLLSEVTFHFAFVRMPKLRNLELSGRFKPSESILKMWTAEA